MKTIILIKSWNARPELGITEQTKIVYQDGPLVKEMIADGTLTNAQALTLINQ